jgi:hypothetical protein
VNEGSAVSGFSVNVGGLMGIHAQMLRMGDGCGSIRDHLMKSDSEAFSGFLEVIKGRFEDVLHAQVNEAIDAQQCAYSVGDEVGNACTYYQGTDEKQMAAFDAKLPGSPGPIFEFSTQISDAPAQSYGDVNSPSGRLREPPSYDEEMSWKPKLQSDIGNVVPFVRGMIKAVIGVDPLETLEKFAAGDWAEVRRILDRFNNAAWAFRDCADNIQHCSTSSESDWTGNAADGARSYMGSLATGFYGEFDKNEFLSTQLKDLAEGVFEAAKALVDNAGDWINNRLLPAIASVGIAGATEEVPIWDFLADGYAGYKAYQAIKEGLEVYEKANAINTMIEGCGAALAVAQNGSLTMPSPVASLPGQPYSSPV